MTTPTALIIIDMQKGMQSSTLPPRNNPQAEDNIARLLTAWREEGQPVVCVRHISRSPSSVFAPGQSGAEFQACFTPLAHEHVVEKNVPDAAFTFDKEDFGGTLRSAKDVYLMALANLHGEYAEVRSTDQVLRTSIL